MFTLRKSSDFSLFGHGLYPAFFAPPHSTNRDCYDKNKFPFKFRKMIQIFDGHNKAMNFSNLDPTVPGQKL